MIQRPVLSLLATLAVCSLGGLATAQTSNWIDFADETGTRLQLTTVGVNDTQEKDITKGDFDNDGDVDIVVVRKVPFSSPGGLPNVLLMNENGVLVDRTTTLLPAFLIPDDARDILAFDANGDGWLDLVIATTFFEQPRLFINQGAVAGVFQGFAEDTNWFGPLFSPAPKFCAVYDGDIDNDGDLDLYFSDYNNVLEDRLLINDGTGKFVDETALRFPTGINDSVFGTGSFICDFNMDGWADILKVSGSFEPMKLLINDGTGLFTQMQVLPSTTVYMARARDFNNDGRTDIYTVSDGQDYLLINASTNPDGTINTIKTNNVSSAKTNGFGGNVHAEDLDRDGFLDPGVADVDVDIPGCTRRFAALRNRSPGSDGFNDPNNSITMPWNSQGTHDFAYFDLNGDGFLDLFQGKCNGFKMFIQKPFAVAASRGQGCLGSNGVPTSGAIGVPSLGNSAFALTLSNAAPNTVPFLVVGPDALELTNVFGCTLLVSPSSWLVLNPVATDGSGNLTVPLPIPNNALLEGLRVFSQFAVPDPQGGFASGFALSDGLDIYVSANTL